MNLRKVLPCTGAILLTFLAFTPPAMAQGDDWRQALKDDIERIDQSFDGELGVYVRHLGNDRTVTHNADRDWYLASTIKIPLAIVLMQRAEDEGLDLGQKLTLRSSDYVDGSGDLLWADPGSRYSLEELNKRSIEDSDSTATDMLIRFLGEASFNRQVASLLPEGFGPITTIVQVRYDAYSEIHPSASELTNRDFIDLKTVSAHGARLDMLLEKMDITPEEAEADSIRSAFKGYYQRGLNSGNLEAFGVMLEELVAGKLLNEAHTDQLIGYLSAITTGDNRIAGGLPQDADFAHKTGTQVARSCDIGVLNPRAPDDAVIVAVCAEDYDTLKEAEKAYQSIGEALHESGLVI